MSSTMQKLLLPNRRRLLLALSGMATLPAMPLAALAAAPRQINILTSYPDEVMARFESAFEKRYPQYRIRFLWRMPHDALPYLEQQSGNETVDVYWSASPRTFARLKDQRLLRKLDIGHGTLPARIGKTQISDPDGYYLATEIAAYVFAWNQKKLDALGVAPPRDWPDLVNPKLRNNIALPVPAEVGFAPVMFDIVLQAYGWKAGWAMWSEIAGLSRLVRRGSTFISDLIGSGDTAIGLSIDFFVNAAIANGADIRQRYPIHNGINPGHIALPLAGNNAAGAQAFAEFVLSPEGQRLLTLRDIRKLPVRPEIYTNADSNEFNPFRAAADGAMNYDGERGRWRLAVISAIFSSMLAEPHAEISALWQRVHVAEAAGKPMAEVRQLLETPPADEATAESYAVKKLFYNDLEGAVATRQDIMQNWSATCAKRRTQAQALLDSAGA